MLIISECVISSTMKTFFLSFFRDPFESDINIIGNSGANLHINNVSTFHLCSHFSTFYYYFKIHLSSLHSIISITYTCCLVRGRSLNLNVVDAFDCIHSIVYIGLIHTMCIEVPGLHREGV